MKITSFTSVHSYIIRLVLQVDFHIIYIMLDIAKKHPQKTKKGSIEP